MKKWLIGCLMALAMVCLMGMTANAETTSNYCFQCEKFTVFEVIRYIPTPISSTPDPDAHWARAKCTNCGNIQEFVPDDNSRFHTGGDKSKVTCTTGMICEMCGAEYGKLPHDWSTWTSSGNNRTHTRICTSCKTVETENCGGDGSATCVKLGKCTTCGGQYYGGHAFPARWKWDSETEVGRDADTHWVRCPNCTEGKAYENTHSFAPGNMYLKSEATCVSKPVYYVNCSTCYYKGTDTYEYQWGNTNPNNHDGGTEVKNAKAATCTEKGYTGDTCCKGCGVKLSDGTDIPANGHDLVKHAAKAATCLEKGWKAYETCKNCSYTTYTEIPALGHDKVHHDAKNPTCTDYGWYAYDTCTRCDYSTRLIRPALGHDLVKHAAKNPTCTEIGWNAYDTCSRCSYTTYQEKAALGHDLVHHDAKAATCTEIGWKAYDTCSRCDYTTYEELKALGHDLVHHEAKDATCTEIGWKAYDTCSRCNYTTYAELPALGHDYKERVHEATCESDGYTSHTCTRCGDRYLTDRVAKLEHWFGGWTPVEETTHEATCLREGCGFAASVDCEMIECTLALDGQEPLTLSLCPVCGRIEGGESLLLENVTAEALKGSLPVSEAFARLFTLENGEKLLAVGFEYGGKLAKADCPVKITLPAEALAGCTLAQVNPDGTQTALELAIDGELAAFALDFTEIPAALIYLVPAA